VVVAKDLVQQSVLGILAPLILAQQLKSKTTLNQADRSLEIKERKVLKAFNHS